MDGLPQIPAGTAMLIRVAKLVVQAVWTCRVCKRVQCTPNAAVYWDGDILFGLVCPNHDSLEIETAHRAAQETTH